MDEKKLNDDEKSTLKKHLEKLKEESSDLKILADYENWMINRGGLWRNFKVQEREHRIKLREIEQQIRDKEIGIQQCEDAIRSGIVKIEA